MSSFGKEATDARCRYLYPVNGRFPKPRIFNRQTGRRVSPLPDNDWV
jgi:hypothetical protein